MLVSSLQWLSQSWRDKVSNDSLPIYGAARLSITSRALIPRQIYLGVASVHCDPGTLACGSLFYGIAGGTLSIAINRFTILALARERAITGVAGPVEGQTKMVINQV
jgi:hypothetical protein